MTAIHWLPGARDDLARLHASIHAHSPDAADRAIETILENVDRLATFPEMGHLWQPDPDFREWPVRFGATGYVVRYRLFHDQVIIVRIWSGLENH